MPETLIGVVVGGLLSGLGTWLALLVQMRRWRTQPQLSYLKEKRDRLHNDCQRIIEMLPKARAENSYPISMLSEMDFLFPESASKAFADMMQDKDKDEKSRKGHHYLIARAMRNEVRLINEEIERVCVGGRVQ